MSIPFDRLLGDLSVETFFRDYYEQKPFILHRGCETFYHELLRLKDLDFLVSSLDGYDNAPIRLAHGNQPAPPIPTTRAGYLDMSRLYEYYYQGMSVVLEKLDRRWAPFNALTEAFTRGFSEVSIPILNGFKLVLFLTPSNSQALPPHYDPADLFILQLEGEKRWRLYGFEKPLANLQHKLADDSVREEVLAQEPQDFVLKAGDLLYFPRGYVHEALTGAEHSLHLTLSIEEPLTWQAVMARFLAEQVAFRRTVPPHSLENGRLTEAAAAELQAMVQALVAAPDWSSSLRALCLKPPTRGRDQTGTTFARINDCHRFSETTMLQRCVADVAPIEFLGTEVRLDFGVGFVKGPLALYEALSFLRERAEPFCLADVPGALSTASKTALLRRLLRDGFLSCCH